jgi:alpha-1,6-mannosyltransferase
MDKVRQWVVAISFIAGFFFLGSFVERTHTGSFMITVGFLFLAYGYVCWSNPSNLLYWLVVAGVCRLVMCLDVPHFSDDFYRFIWDGRLWLRDQHPFEKLPSDFLAMNLEGLDATLYQKLNSKNYFTVYPPLSQVVFWISAKFSASISGSVAIMRWLILLAEAGSCYLLIQIIRHWQLPPASILFYMLNPLIIIELTGNVHFEAFIVLFVLGMMYAWIHHKMVAAACMLACAVAFKLTPLILVPFLILQLSLRQALLFLTVLFLSMALFLWPMYSETMIQNFQQSIHLYFQTFEFNASLYYLFREYGFWKWGFNTIHAIGWKLAWISFIGIIAFSWYRARWSVSTDKGHLAAGLLFIYVIYLLCATTVHPWYLAPLIMLATLSGYRFVLVWSGLIFFTYTGYHPEGYSENLFLTVTEYSILLLYLGYEILWKRSAAGA